MEQDTKANGKITNNTGKASLYTKMEKRSTANGKKGDKIYLKTDRGVIAIDILLFFILI